MEDPVKFKEREHTSTTTRWGPPAVLRRGNTHTTMAGAYVPPDLTAFIRSRCGLLCQGNHRKKNVDIDKFWNEVEGESLDIEHTKEKKQLQLDQLKIARIMTKGTEDGVGNIMKNVNTELGEPKPKRRANTDDKSCTSSAGTSDEMYKSVDDESEDSEESDEEDELRLDVEEIGFEEYIDQGNEPAIKTFSRETLEDLRKDIKPKLIGKEKVSRDIKSILQDYIEVALDDNDGGLHELRETITESFSKEFNSTAEKEFLRRMKFLFEHL
ncbi:12803_t:CDS:2 [Acaulospora colombiana]|uniref:12803_t:CDS:1 n=1 Tax=Acaulospora colombiana TaxID=27376 RepID=A0ACA9LER3_9GLOM|nr:12803_t:CDS:2 [Acaulospora colombiana]